MRSFLRPVMRRKPSASTSPRSPVRSQPPSSVSARRLRVAVVAGEHVRPAQEDLAVRRDRDLRARQRRPDGAEAEGVGRVERRGGAASRSSRSPRGRHAAGVEELEDLAADRRRAGERHLQPAAEQRAHLGQHEPVGERVPARRSRARAAAGLPRPRASGGPRRAPRSKSARLTRRRPPRPPGRACGSSRRRAGPTGSASGAPRRGPRRAPPGRRPRRRASRRRRAPRAASRGRGRGRAAGTGRRPRPPSARAGARTCSIVARQLACVSTQPFGGPVVPDV